MSREFKTDRRNFMKAGAALAASLAIPSSSAQAKGNAPASDFKPMSKVNCFSEDGELKEVIFGTMEGFRLPAYDPIFDFAGPKIVDLLKRDGGKMFSEAEPEWNKKVTESLKKKKWIKLKREEATDKLANFIAINPEEVVMPLEAERLRKEIEALRPRIKVHAFPYYEVGKIGGSLRCNTCPIYREG